MKFNYLFYNKNVCVLLVVNVVFFVFFKNIIGDVYVGKMLGFKYVCVFMIKIY